MQAMQAPSREDVEGTWRFLEQGVNKVMLDLHSGLDLGSYMAIYTAVHNFCTASKPAAANPSIQLYTYNERVGGTGAQLLGEDLYNKLGEYLTSHLAQVYQQSLSHHDEALLSFYIREWQRYTTAAKYVNHLFRYLNRHWVKREVDEGKREVYDVYTMHLVRWRDDFFSKIQSRLIQAVLNLIEQQRNGETIEQTQIKAIVDSYVSLGLDKNDHSKTTLEIYQTYFSAPFVAATRTYYENEARQFVAENSVVEYMKKAEARLDEEQARINLYLHPDITKALMQACEDVLVAQQSAILRDEFQSLLDAEREDDLARMYRLLSRISGGLEPLRSKFETHVRKAGLAAVAKINTGSTAIDPKLYIDALLEVHSKYENLVNTAFGGESEFVRSLDNACREFVNRNVLCSTNSTRSPELLAKYTDSLLRKGTKAVEDTEMEEVLQRIMIIFRYIEDKDVFQKFYSRNLAKRLVNVTSVSDDAEESMIGKLKGACGYEYTNKLQRMFQDIQISKDLNSSYREWQQSTYDDSERKRMVDTHFQILGTGFWPLSPPNSKFQPPPEIAKTTERFKTFYFDKHNGRKLTWLWQLCKGEIKANYLKNTKVPCTFQVSTFQMGILLLYNDHESLDYSDIEKATQLSPEVLDANLGFLAKVKVLTTTPENSEPVPGITYSLNTNFKPKKMKINLNITPKAETKHENEETHKTVEEDRKLLLQSAIVRVMKSRKQMKHVQLVQEVINQVNKRFPPRVSDIKKNIEALLEKEYIERVDNDEIAYIA
ncbi:hypothetical protein KEM56_005427 [Ascosphaera pollenicola]|nr:hypothetical protein KEM56_005427 [Ascosphaera pollenicola]